MESIRVAVLEEHEIFRLGVVACLQAHPGISVVAHGTTSEVGRRDDLDDLDLDVVITSRSAAGDHRFGCPVVVIAPDATAVALASGEPPVAGRLPLQTLTAERLVAATTAAAAGLEVTVSDDGTDHRLDDRSLHVLRQLADGADTRTIAADLDCSLRTVKAIVQDLKQALAARSRAQAVAQAIRRGLI
jgi:DNA-binding NarL/FixJ family response regulator